jgi:hypothetical protein
VPAWLISFLPVLGVIVGATLQYGLSRTHEARKQQQALRTAAYVDFLRGCANTAQAQQRGDGAEEAKGNALMADAKARLCVYGSESAIRALADFFRKGGNLSSRGSVDAFLSFCEAIRLEALERRLERSDISQVLGLRSDQLPP